MHLIFSLEKKQKIILIKCSIYVISKKKERAVYIALAIIIWGCIYPFLFDNTVHIPGGEKLALTFYFFFFMYVVI